MAEKRLYQMKIVFENGNTCELRVFAENDEEARRFIVEIGEKIRNDEYTLEAQIWREL